MNRRRSAAAQRNDELLLDAAADEILAVGVDRLAMSAVARRADLTTGALYSRYENVGELAAAVWTARVRDPHHELLDIAIRGLVDRDRSAPLDRLGAELQRASATTLLAIEFLATARRVDELEEVVIVDVQSWLDDWHAAPRARDQRRRAQVVYTLAVIWGVALHEIASPRALDWSPITKGLRFSYARPVVIPTEPNPSNQFGPVVANTGNEGQNALIGSVAAIVSRVGLERASATRIARRAGLSAGSIYARYRTKAALLRDAVDVLLAARLADDLAFNEFIFTAADPGSATAAVVGGYLSAPRREWRRFRIEAQLAARHQPELSSTLDRIQESAIRDYVDALGARNDDERAALDLIARFAHVTPLGLAFADLVVPGVPEIDWRLVLNPLLSPQ